MFDVKEVIYTVKDGESIEYSVGENQAFIGFDDMVAEVESSNGDMKVCRRCGANFKSGEGFEIEGLDLCLDCLGAVKEKLSEDSAEPETGKCECDCKNEKCDCEKCECDSEEVAEESK